MLTNILEEYSAAMFASTMKPTQCHDPEGCSVKLADMDTLTFTVFHFKSRGTRPKFFLIALTLSMMRWTFLVVALRVDSHIKTYIVPNFIKFSADMYSVYLLTTSSYISCVFV
jgi:hypothetical protein